MSSKEAAEKLQAELNSVPCPFKHEDWYKEGIKAAQEKILKSFLIADPE